MRLLSTMGLAALAAASVTAVPARSAGVVVGKMQELNLEQVCAAPNSLSASKCLAPHSLSRLTLPPAGRST